MENNFVLIIHADIICRSLETKETFLFVLNEGRFKRFVQGQIASRKTAYSLASLVFMLFLGF